MCTYMGTSVCMCTCPSVMAYTVCMTIHVCLWVRVSVHLNVHVFSLTTVRCVCPTPSILTCKSHGQRSLAGLQSMRLRRGRHSLATKQLCTCAHVGTVYLCVCVCICTNAYVCTCIFFMSMCVYVNSHASVCVHLGGRMSVTCVCVHTWAQIS